MSPGNGSGRPGKGGPVNPDNVNTIPESMDKLGLTREQFVHWQGWLADSYDLPRERLGFAVLVRTSAGTYRRRLYLSLDAAYRAIERAELRGVEAHAVMVELRQVGEIR